MFKTVLYVVQAALNDLKWLAKAMDLRSAHASTGSTARTHATAPNGPSFLKRKAK